MLRVGKKKNIVLNKYLLFEIFSYFYSDYQAIQIIMRLCKQGAELVM